MSTIQIRKKGNVTLPAELRNKYDLEEGDVFTLIDLGDGSLLLTPRISQVNRSGDRISEILIGKDISIDDLLNSLVEYHGNAVESWSLSSKIASWFGGARLAMKVPIKNIVSTAVSGFGCLSEGEIVVGGNLKATATLIQVSL